MNKPCKRNLKDSIREIIFGLEDSLVTSLGTVTGVAAATHSAGMVIISGVVVVCVSTLSMSAGSYLSSKSAESIGRKLNERALTNLSLRAALVMGVSYLLGGFIPIIPYVFDYFITSSVAISLFTLCSLVITGATLFGVGYWSAGCTKRNPLTSGIEMLLVSLGAAFVGSLAGWLIHSLLSFFASV